MLRISRTLGLVVLLLLAAQSAFAQSTTTTATSDPQAVALATKAIAALTGGVSIKDVTLTGTAALTAGSGAENGTITLKALGTSASRSDLALPGGIRTEIRNVSSDGIFVGEQIAPDGTHAIANHNCFTDAVWFLPSLGTVSQATNSGFVFSYVGQETRNGQPVIHISAYQLFPLFPPRGSAIAQSLSQTDIYLDPTTLLPVVQISATHPDDHMKPDLPVEIRFSDYQAVNGVLVPFRIQKYVSNGLVLDVQLQAAAVNTGLPANDFALE